MPLPRSEGGEADLVATKLQFTYVECLMHVFHQLARNIPLFLVDPENADRLKDFRSRYVWYTCDAEAEVHYRMSTWIFIAHSNGAFIFEGCNILDSEFRFIWSLSDPPLVHQMLKMSQRRSVIFSGLSYSHGGHSLNILNVLIMHILIIFTLILGVG